MAYSNTSFIDMFGKIVKKFNASAEVGDIYETLRFSHDEIIETVVGYDENDREVEKMVIDPVMPSSEHGDCVSFRLQKTGNPIARIK